MLWFGCFGLVSFLFCYRCLSRCVVIDGIYNGSVNQMVIIKLLVKNKVIIIQWFSVRSFSSVLKLSEVIKLFCTFSPSLFINPLHILLALFPPRCRLILIDIYDRLIAYLAEIQSRPLTSSIKSLRYINSSVGLDSVVVGGNWVKVWCVCTSGSD